MSISGEESDGDANRAQIGAKQAAGGVAEAPHLPVLHAEGFDDTDAGDRLVQDVLDLRQFVLAPASGMPHPGADLARRHENKGHEDQQHQGELVGPGKSPTPISKIKVKNCCRNSARTVDSAICTRSMSLMVVESRVPVGTCWKKATERRRMAS